MLVEKRIPSECSQLENGNTSIKFGLIQRNNMSGGTAIPQADLSLH